MARLDKYLAKLNGAAGSVPAPVSSLDREMDELAKNPPSGGGLPEVTAADNGDVLTVVDGEWGKAGGLPEVETVDKGKFLHANDSTGELEWAEASGGTDFFVVTFTNHYGLTAEYLNTTADKTYSEIDAVKRAGTPIIAKVQSQVGTGTPNENGYLPLYYDVTGYVASHVQIGYPNDTVMVYVKYLITSQDQVTKTDNAYTLTPAT